MFNSQFNIFYWDLLFISCSAFSGLQGKPLHIAEHKGTVLAIWGDSIALAPLFKAPVKAL
jgi:hypothetical protein